jgi:hypothetical protein
MSTRQEPFPRSKGALPSTHVLDDAILRERAHAPVESAIRSHFASFGGADDAAVRNATSIVLRGLTHSALTHIASAGISGTELIQTLIPKPAQPGTLPAVNWSALTPAEIQRLQGWGLLTERQAKAALGMRDSSDNGPAASGSESSARLDGLSRSEAAYFSEMRSHALKHGLGWAADNRDILRLGPAAIETFARMKFDRDSYHALTRDAGLSPEKAVGLVSSMENAKIKPNEAKDLARRMGATSKGLTPELQEQHRQLMENWLKSLKADPGAAPAELGKLHKWLDERKAADPGKASAVDDEKKAVKQIQERLQEERAREIRTDAIAAAKEVRANVLGSEFDALLAGAPTQNAQTPAVITPGQPAQVPASTANPQQQAQTPRAAPPTVGATAQPTTPVPPTRQVGAAPKPA